MNLGSLKAKLIFGFFLAFIPTLVLTVVDVYSVNQGNDALAYVYENRMKPTTALREMDSAIKEIRFRMAGVLLDQMPAAGSRNHLKEVRGKIFEDWASFKQATSGNEFSEEARTQIGKIDKQIALLPAYLDKLDSAYEADEKSLLTPMLEDEWPAFHSGLIKPISVLLPEQQIAVMRTYEDSKTNGVRLVSFGITILGISLIIGIIAAFLIIRAITRPLQRAVAVADAVAHGDLTQRIEVKSRDEIGQLMQALKVMNESLSASKNETERMVREVAEIVESAAQGDFSVRLDVTDKSGLFKQLGAGINNLVQTSEAGLGEVARVLSAMSRGDLTEKITNEYSGTFGQLKDDSNSTIEKLNRIVLQIKVSTDSITTAAQQIAAGNNDLSQRTEEQASSLEETASSMEELTSTVKQNADNARHANQLAQGTNDIAVQGGKTVEMLVATMTLIKASSKKIEDIISVIEGIAFQTNILALNAAVEAARAGEQGRGFAVVASEVRNLAQRSAAAAKEIKTLIGDSVEKVGAGSKQVEDAQETIDDVVTSVHLVATLLKEISVASAEQSSGIEQVNQAITQMDKVTQQNAALVEEAAAAAESMREQAGNLVEAVSFFKVEKRGQSTGRHPTVPSAAAAAKMVTMERKAIKINPGKAEDWKEF